MKAPDKIFILYHKDYSDRRILNAFTEKDNDTDIEYIRKDALLEWASKENLKFNQIGNVQDDDFARGIAAGLGYLISKLGSL